MNNRLSKLFSKKNKAVLNIYCTAGYPYLDSTKEVLLALQNAGADMVEIGIPYSDPIADGPVIQQSNMQALQNGMSISTLFQQLQNLRNDINIPIVLMSYLNPILQFGIEKFCQQAEKVEVDGVIIPDLPMHEFKTLYGQYISRHNLTFTFLITPQTADERIKQIDELSTGFIYAVSSSATTGFHKSTVNKVDYFKRLQTMRLTNPVLVGFGISDKKSFDEACEFTSGAIIGSAYIRALQSASNIEQVTKNFINKIVTVNDITKTG